MKLILANPRGFCAGVQMAVDVVSQTIKLLPGEKVYVFHEIVHNRHVVGRFQQQGVEFVESLDDVPEGCIVVFSAHGVSPQVREHARTRRLQTIDATCPLVTKVHSECIRYARQGFQILLVGHANHQEVVGTRGEAPDSVTVVESVEQVRALKVNDESRLVYLTQTTLSTDDAGVIIKALKERFPQIKEPPSSDICYATTNRQHAVRQIAPECELVLVIGSKNSSNSVRLTEISQNVGTPARLIDDVSEVDWSWFKGDETVMITAGASAPEDLVAELCRTLLRRFGGELIQRDVFNEDVEFGLPASLKRLGKTKGVDLENSRIRVGAPVITQSTYGAVPLTVSAKSN
ncbi:MAG: 4-hydroxy-3-methylbut-2-enyl diphosphate reductase [Phycisphaerales bacterium]